MQYYGWVRGATQAELEAERMRLAMSAGNIDPLVGAVRLSLLLTSSTLASAETQREALAALEAVEGREPAAASLREYSLFASILLAQLREQVSLRDELLALLREQASQREEIIQLEEKIEALTNIEQQIIEREREQIQNGAPLPPQESPPEEP